MYNDFGKLRSISRSPIGSYKFRYVRRAWQTLIHLICSTKWSLTPKVMQGMLSTIGILAKHGANGHVKNFALYLIE